MPEETKEPLQVSKLRKYYGEELYTLAQFVSRHLLLATINKRISGQVGSVSTLHVLMSCSIFFYFYLFWLVSITCLPWKNLKLNSSEYHSAGKVTFHLSNLTGICFLFQKWWGSKSCHILVQVLMTFLFSEAVFQSCSRYISWYRYSATIQKNINISSKSGADSSAKHKSNVFLYTDSLHSQNSDRHFWLSTHCSNLVVTFYSYTSL